MDIAGIAIAKGDRLKLRKKHSKLIYLISLFIIMGPYHFFKNSSVTLSYRIKKKLAGYFDFFIDSSLAGLAKKFKIPICYVDNPNNEDFLKHLKEVAPDIIINQSQHIIKKNLLEIPRLGVLNRHNALLPKNRGRLTPFWVVFKGELETGVTIHKIDEGIDSGPIIVQKRFPVLKDDTFNSIVRKNYAIASSAMLEALEKLNDENCLMIENDSDAATYNTIPTLAEAIHYRWLLTKRQLLKDFKRLA